MTTVRPASRVAALLAIAAGGGAHAASFDIGEGTMGRGGSVVVPVTIAHEGQVTAFQFDLLVPGNVLPPKIGLRPPRLAGAIATHRLSNSNPAGALLRVVVVSDANLPLPNPATVELRFSADADAPGGNTIPIGAANLVLSDGAAAAVVPQTVGSGSVSVTTVIDPIFANGFE
jgi:hypothetical protein